MCIYLYTEKAASHLWSMVMAIRVPRSQKFLNSRINFLFLKFDTFISTFLHFYIFSFKTRFVKAFNLGMNNNNNNNNFIINRQRNLNIGISLKFISADMVGQ